jgi:putative ABC transport system permease protein
MMLALNEIRRSKGRFASIVAALSLIVFLVLVLAALADGLFYGATGAIRSTNATAYAFGDDAKGSLVRSRIPAADVAAFSSAPGVEQASGVGVLLTGGQGPDGEVDLAIFGVEPDGAGVPTTLVEGRLPGEGEDGVAAVDRRLADDGVAIGSTVSVGDVPVEVVGFVQDAAYQLQPTVWTSLPTWRSMLEAVRPEQRGQPDFVSAVALRTADGTSLTAVSDAVTGTQVLSTDETGLAIPGVAQQKSTLNAIIYTTLAVAAIVVALFFALLILEKRELFAALKALGTSTGRLGRGVIVQALVSSAFGVVVGAVAARLLGLAIPPAVPTLFRPETLVVISVFTLVAGVVGAAFSLRRIARIDPATAIGGTL